MSRNLTDKSKTLTKKLEILKSAAKEFRNNGFERTQMSSIANKLSLQKGALYYYFKSKQELLYFCQSHSLDRLIDEARSIAKKKVRADEKLRLIVESHLTRILDELEGASAHIEFQALEKNQRRTILKKRDSYEEIIRGIIDKGIEQGKFIKENPKLIAHAILGALNWCATWYRPDGELPSSQIAGFFSTFISRAITV